MRPNTPRPRRCPAKCPIGQPFCKTTSRASFGLGTAPCLSASAAKPCCWTPCSADTPRPSRLSRAAIKPRPPALANCRPWTTFYTATTTTTTWTSSPCGTTSTAIPNLSCRSIWARCCKNGASRPRASSSWIGGNTPPSAA